MNTRLCRILPYYNSDLTRTGLGWRVVWGIGHPLWRVDFALIAVTCTRCGLTQKMFP